MKKLNELFEVTYGNKLDLNKMRPWIRADDGVNFVGRSSENNGVSATVARISDVEPYEPGLITVALGGAKLLSAFVQESAFYTAQNVAVLRPLRPMSFAEKIYLCICIRHNRFRYSAFGREANRTLRTLMVPEPEEFPAWVANTEAIFRAANVGAIQAPAEMGSIDRLLVAGWKWFTLSELFELKKGKRLTKANMRPGGTPFIGAIDNNNGVSGFVAQPPLHPGNTITVNYNGNGVAEAFYQSVPFRCSDDVNVLYPKFTLNVYIALFLTTLIRLEKYRFSYGRKWHLERMQTSRIKLPVTADRSPDFKYMESFIKKLPFSSQVEIDEL